MSNLPPTYLTRGQKRRFSEDEEMGDAPSVAFVPIAGKQQTNSYEAKRLKTGIQKRTTNSAMLAMDKCKLIEIIMSLLDAHPNVRTNIMTLIPAPTIASAKSVLLQMEKQLADSFPYNRHGPARDNYTYSRVRGPLQDLIDTLNQYAHHFTSSMVLPSTCFTFLDLATQTAHRLPEWDNNKNNLSRNELYADLNNFWKTAIQVAMSRLREGESYNPQSVSEWAQSLAQHNAYTGGLFTDAVQEFSKKLLNSNAPPPAEAPVCHHTVLDTDMNRFASQSSPVVGYAGAQR